MQLKVHNMISELLSDVILCPCRNKWSAQEIDNWLYMILIQLQCLYDKSVEMNWNFNNAEGCLYLWKNPLEKLYRCYDMDTYMSIVTARF